MKIFLKQLLLVAVCSNIAIGILQARETNPKPKPNTTKYLKYETEVFNACSKINFEAFYTDRVSNLYASTSKMRIEGSKNIFIKEIYKINTSGACIKFSTLKEHAGYSLNTPAYNMLVDMKRKFIYFILGNTAYPYNAYLVKYNLAGKFINQTKIPNSKSSNIASIEMDTYGNVYVLNKDQSLIHKFTASGRFLLTWGGKGTYDGKFSNPSSLAIDKYNNIYVADTGNYRIQKFDSIGNFITKWGSKKSDSSPNDEVYEFYYPYKIGVDNNLNVYVNSTVIHGLTRISAIKKFDRNGDYIDTWK